MTDEREDESQEATESSEREPPEEPLGSLKDRLDRSAGRTERERDEADVEDSTHPPEGDRDRSGPLGDLADDLDRRRSEREPVDDELFEEESTPEIDPETVWEQVQRDEPEAVDADDPDNRVERVIDTGSYCEQCEYFSAPPDVHCTHEGTEIVEMVDIDHFRVLDCPVVREDETLEQL